MRQLAAILVTGALAFFTGAAGAQTCPVHSFYKVMISPYIQASFVQGNEESVTINSCIVDSSKLHIEVHHGVLRVYLDGARDIPHYEHNEGYNGNGHLYRDHSVVVTVHYKKLDAVSLRGEEKYLFESPMVARDLRLWVYGESTVIFTEVHIGKMHTTIYGQSTLDIRSGEVNRQNYTCYGEGKILGTAIAGRAAKVTAYGEAEFQVNVSDRIKLTAFGDAKLRYMGNPAIVKGIHLGDVDVKRME
ncbi:MAG TPA: DUF2807 domain-containing protein [Puia sp.]|nr:DUF2807 domain-containing protein [Puia sp.]